MQAIKFENKTISNLFTKYRDYLAIMGIILLVKAIIFLYGAISYEIFTNKHFSSINSFFSIWNQWDSINYLNIAEKGYNADPRKGFLLAFFPLYPWMTRIFTYLTNNYFLSAMLISTIASIIMVILLYKLSLLDNSKEESRMSVWFLLIFPTAYFIHIGYSESLFLVLTLSSFLMARKRKWTMASIFGALAVLTRNSGICLIPALAVEAYLQYREEKKWRWEWLTILFIISGLFVFAYVSYKTVGDPFGFFASQRKYWGKELTVPWMAIISRFKDTAIWFNWKNPTESTIELAFTGAALFVAIAGIRRVRVTYSVWVIANLIFFLSTKFMQSIPRYILVLFPLYFIFSKWSKNIYAAYAITLISILFLSLFTMMFVEGFWAF